MNMITYFNELVTKNFNNYLKKYFNKMDYAAKCGNFVNYYNFMNDLDSFNNSFIKDIIKSYFEYIDECFFHSSYRKNFCKSNGFYERKNYVTLFGDINFKRRYYYDKNTKEYFFFTDLFFGLPKRKHFDPFVCAELCDQSTTESYSKAGKIIATKIGKRINNNITINRATVRNIVLSFNPEYNKESEFKRVEKLFVMLDEKFIGSQFNDGKDIMTKASVIFEGAKPEYKYKKKDDSKTRYKLINPHACASIDDELLEDTINYIYNNYDVNYIKEINFMGDCAKWIKTFPNSHWFKFTSDTIVQFAMDNFHFKQALTLLTTKKYQDVNDALLEYVNSNNKKDFNILVEQFKDLNPDRTETIESKQNYILNNWKERQTYLKNPYIKCSMESHISHILADLFTARPKAYSKKGLRKLLKLRLLKINKVDIKQLYLSQLINHSVKKENNYIKINANKIIFPTDTKINKYLNNFYNTGLDPFDYIQKEISYL